MSGLGLAGDVTDVEPVGHWAFEASPGSCKI